MGAANNIIGLLYQTWDDSDWVNSTKIIFLYDIYDNKA